MDRFAEVLAHVAKDLAEYAEALKQGDNEWRPEWSTYSVEAANAVHALLVQDKEI